MRMGFVIAAAFVAIVAWMGSLMIRDASDAIRRATENRDRVIDAFGVVR